MLVVLPIAFIGILGLSTGRLLGQGSQLLKVAIVDLDQSTESQQLVDRIKSQQAIRVLIAASVAEANQQLANRDCNVVAVIGVEFSELADQVKVQDVLAPESGKLSAGVESLDINIRGRPTSSTPAKIVEQLIFADAIQTLMPILIRKNPLARRLIKLPEKSEQPVEESDESEDTPDAGSGVYQQLVPSYTVMFAFFLVNIMARSFIAERDLGTLRRLRTTPISTLQLMMGKTLPFLLISLLQSVALFLAGRVLFGMSWGPQPWLLIPVIMATSAAATAMGLLVAALVRTDSQVSAYANFLVITMAGISGCFMPRDWLPELMQNVSLATPHAWALIAYEQILSSRVPNPATIAQCCAALLAFSAAYFAIGLNRYRVGELAS